jgi:hypothetical protein
MSPKPHEKIEKSTNLVAHPVFDNEFGEIFHKAALARNLQSETAYSMAVSIF